MSLCRYMIRTCRMKQDHSRWSATWRVGTLQLGPVLSRRGNSPTDLDDSMDVPTMAIHRRFLDPFDDHLTHSHIEIQREWQPTHLVPRLPRLPRLPRPRLGEFVGKAKPSRAGNHGNHMETKKKTKNHGNNRKTQQSLVVPRRPHLRGIPGRCRAEAIPELRWSGSLIGSPYRGNS